MIPYAWIKRAIRQIPAGLTGIKVLGVDVARGGNDSTVFTYGFKTSDGFYIAQDGAEYRKQDTMETTAKIIDLDKVVGFNRVTIDAGGLGGGPYDRLKEKRSEGFKPLVIPYEGGKSSITEFQRKTRERKEIKTRFLNIKAEAYFRLRGLFEEDKIILSPDLMKKYPKYVDQLIKMKWGMTTSEKIRIFDPGTAPDDSAEEKSPDFADSLCYMCWEGVKPPVFFGTLQT